MAKHTRGPWRWMGEDYRGGWGWQLLVGPEGEGILCGSDRAGGPYRHLEASRPIEPKYCRTGMAADLECAPAVHVGIADAQLIAAAPDLLEACEQILSVAETRDITELFKAVGMASRAVQKAKATR
jgi:hypothetical protein